jgi:hypothetical protein
VYSLVTNNIGYPFPQTDIHTQTTVVPVCALSSGGLTQTSRKCVLTGVCEYGLTHTRTNTED